ncbi:MAG: hypothetical protein ACSLEZ_14840 [Thiobacillus sp.]
MRFFRFLILSLYACLPAAQADVPDYRTFPATGQQLLLWVASERGRAEPELRAAQQLAAQGVEVWSLDLASAYFLPQLASSMEAVPRQDMVDWLRVAQASGKQVTVYTVARAAVPVLRAAAALEPAERVRLCVMLMYPNLYTVAEPLAKPDYLAPGSLAGLRVRVLQPRRSAATPWLPGLLDHLARQGATVSHVVLENLREGYWVREAPTEFEIAESRRMDAMLLRELNAWGCQ